MDEAASACSCLVQREQGSPGCGNLAAISGAECPCPCPCPCQDTARTGRVTRRNSSKYPVTCQSKEVLPSAWPTPSLPRLKWDTEEALESRHKLQGFVCSFSSAQESFGRSGSRVHIPPPDVMGGGCSLREGPGYGLAMTAVKMRQDPENV